MRVDSSSYPVRNVEVPEMKDLRERNIQTIAEIIELIESEIPVNPNAARSRRLERRLERELSEYFNMMMEAIPIEQIEQLYYKEIQS